MTTSNKKFTHLVTEVLIVFNKETKFQF